MKITHRPDPFEVDVKRFYFPSTLEGTCPNCQAPFKHDFSDYYLSYPVTNTPFNQGCYCEVCEHEWKVRLSLRIELELVEQGGTPGGETQEKRAHNAP
jgi:hypothetical protein